MEDLRQKTDDELRDIMRSSISNQYVPSSIYHKAKQELEFRQSNQSTFHNIHNSNIAVGSQEISQSSINHNSQKKPEISPWFWWLMSIVGALIATLVAAWVFGIGK